LPKTPGRHPVVSGGNGIDFLRHADTHVLDAATMSELLALKSMVRFSPVAFSPDGRFMATGYSPNNVKLWGASNAEVYAARRNARAVELELGSLVEDWFKDSIDEAVRQLRAKEHSLTPDQYRTAKNMVLIRASGITSPITHPE